LQFLFKNNQRFFGLQGFNALATFTSLAMLPFVLLSHHCVLVLVKQYQACRGVFIV
jgi:hypothetical protein